MARDDNKADISRDTLRRHGIFFHPADNEADSFKLPDHINSVCEVLLGMKNVVTGDWTKHLHAEADIYAEQDMGPTWSSAPPDFAFVQEEQHHIDRDRHSTPWRSADKRLKKCLKTAKKARKLLHHPEAEWNHFWRSNVFRLFSDVESRQAGFNPMLDRWSFGFHDWTESPAECASDRTIPKPDLTYAFPIQGSQTKASPGLARDELLQTFSLPVFENLIKAGMACTPTSAIKQWLKAPDRKQLSDTDRSCFPWAVVEMKRHREKHEAAIQDCYCQAANAAAAALDMQAQLFRRANHECLSTQPPIVVFTCVGPIVKIWLAYQDQPDLSERQKKWMVCIRTTSVQLTWGVASLRRILNNMHFWASRLLKPRLQDCIYRVFASLQQAGQDRSRATSLRTASSNIDILPSKATHALYALANDPALGTDALTPPSNPSSTPQSQQSSFTEINQTQTQTKHTINEPQRSYDCTQSEVPKTTSHAFGADKWKSALFRFEFNPNSDEINQLDGLSKPANYNHTSSIHSESPEEPYSPTPLRPAPLPITPQPKREKLCRDNRPSVQAVSSSRPVFEKSIARNTMTNCRSTGVRHTLSASRGRIDQRRSQNDDAIFSCQNTGAKKLVSSRGSKGKLKECASPASSDMTEIFACVHRIFGQSQPASQAATSEVGADHHNELKSRPSGEVGTPRDCGNQPEASFVDIDDDATPRPSARSDSSKSGSLYAIRLSNALNQQHRGSVSHNNIFDRLASELNTNSSTTAAKQDAAFGLGKSDGRMKPAGSPGPYSSTPSVTGVNSSFDFSGMSQAISSVSFNIFESTCESYDSDDENDSDFQPDPTDRSNSGDDEYSDVPTDSDVTSEHSQEYETEEIGSRSGRSVDSYCL